MKKDKSTKKTIFIILWFITFIAFVALIVRFNMYGTAGKFYNQGNSYFKEGDYETAENRYSRAYIERFSKWMDCRLRINYALSITTPITPDSVTSYNVDEAVERLEEAINILTMNGCAHMNDSKGHNKKAQTLKDEIEDYIKWLKENNPPPQEDQSGDNSDDSNSSSSMDRNEGKQNKTDPKQSELRDKFNSIQQEGMDERLREQNSRQSMGEYSGYSGKNW